MIIISSEKNNHIPAELQCFICETTKDIFLTSLRNELTNIITGFLVVCHDCCDKITCNNILVVDKEELSALTRHELFGDKGND